MWATNERTKFQIVTKVIKCFSLPVLLLTSMRPRHAGGYELLVDLAICLGAIAVVQWEIQSGEYYWAAGFVAIAVVFSPLFMIFKIFLLLVLACAVTSVTLLAAFRSQQLVVRD